MSTQGPNFGSAATGNTGGEGSPITDWTNPTNANADDGAAATSIASPPIQGTTADLIVTGFGFSIPSGATINGVTVDIKRKDPLGNCADRVVKLVVSGAAAGNNKAAASTLYPFAAFGTATYGSASDLWGNALTDAIVNASNFGVLLRVQSISPKGSAGTPAVDFIRITITYTGGGGGGAFKPGFIKATHGAIGSGVF
jgi:hypothetical protein